METMQQVVHIPLAWNVVAISHLPSKIGALLMNVILISNSVVVVVILPFANFKISKSEASVKCSPVINLKPLISEITVRANDCAPIRPNERPATYRECPSTIRCPRRASVTPPCGRPVTHKSTSKPKGHATVPLPVLDAGDGSGPTSRTSIKASRMGPRRAAVLILVHVLIIAHIIQWRLTGRTISPVEPSESMFTLEQGLVNAGFIFFSLAILSTLIFGRFFCGWRCKLSKGS